jgi:hypothetical protein
VGCQIPEKNDFLREFPRIGCVKMNTIPRDIANIICDYSHVNNIAVLRASNSQLQNIFVLGKKMFSRDKCDRKTITTYALGVNPDTENIAIYISSCEDKDVEVVELIMYAFDHFGKTGMIRMYSILDSISGRCWNIIQENQKLMDRFFTDAKFGTALLHLLPERDNDTYPISSSMMGDIILSQIMTRGYSDERSHRLVTLTESVLNSEFLLSESSKTDVYFMFAIYVFIRLVVLHPHSFYELVVETTMLDQIMPNLQHLSQRLNPIILRCYELVEDHIPPVRLRAVKDKLLELIGYLDQER